MYVAMEYNAYNNDLLIIHLFFFFIRIRTQEASFRFIPNPTISMLIAKNAGAMHSRCLDHLANFSALQFVGLQSYSVSYI